SSPWVERATSLEEQTSLLLLTPSECASDLFATVNCTIPSQGKRAGGDRPSLQSDAQKQTNYELYYHETTKENENDKPNAKPSEAGIACAVQRRNIGPVPAGVSGFCLDLLFLDRQSRWKDRDAYSSSHRYVNPNRNGR